MMVTTVTTRTTRPFEDTVSQLHCDYWWWLCCMHTTHCYKLIHVSYVDDGCAACVQHVLHIDTRRQWYRLWPMPFSIYRLTGASAAVGSECALLHYLWLRAYGVEQVVLRQGLKDIRAYRIVRLVLSEGSLCLGCSRGAQHRQELW